MRIYWNRQKSPLKDSSKSQIAYFDFESLLIRRFWEMTRVWLESQKNDLSSALDPRGGLGLRPRNCWSGRFKSCLLLWSWVRLREEKRRLRSLSLVCISKCLQHILCYHFTRKDMILKRACFLNFVFRYYDIKFHETLQTLCGKSRSNCYLNQGSGPVLAWPNKSKSERKS